MKQLLKRRHDEIRAGEREGGFTLIELLVVIVILAILAAVVVFAVGGITDKGQTSSCKADRRTLETAEEAYFAKNTAYTTEAGLVPTFLATTSPLHDIALTTGSYTISKTGDCASNADPAA